MEQFLQQGVMKNNGASNPISPKDVFLELWVMGSLYLSAVFVIALLFQYVNYFFPDPANPYSFSQISLRWMVAILIAVLPTHIFVLRLREKDYSTFPEKRESKLRKWLVYLTLFVAAITCVVDFSILIYYFLGGELSIRFLLKVFAVAIVAGGIFWYYLADLKRKTPEIPGNIRFIRQTALILVIFVILGAFFISGSPFRARLEKLDQQRVADLQNIQWQLIYHWQKKGAIPASLSELADSISGYVVPRDPETKVDYEYRKLEDLSFELCANFSANTPKDQTETYKTPAYYTNYTLPNPRPIENQDNWRHTAGRACFLRDIDPKLYAPVNEKPVD